MNWRREWVIRICKFSYYFARTTQQGGIKVYVIFLKELFTIFIFQSCRIYNHGYTYNFEMFILIYQMCPKHISGNTISDDQLKRKLSYRICYYFWKGENREGKHDDVSCAGRYARIISVYF